jgi:hypothetical protein
VVLTARGGPVRREGREGRAIFGARAPSRGAGGSGLIGIVGVHPVDGVDPSRAVRGVRHLVCAEVRGRVLREPDRADVVLDPEEDGAPRADLGGLHVWEPGVEVGGERPTREHRMEKRSHVLEAELDLLVRGLDRLHPAGECHPVVIDEEGLSVREHSAVADDHRPVDPVEAPHRAVERAVSVVQGDGARGDPLAPEEHVIASALRGWDGFRGKAGLAILEAPDSLDGQAVEPQGARSGAARGVRAHHHPRGGPVGGQGDPEVEYEPAPLPPGGLERKATAARRPAVRGQELVSVVVRHHERGAERRIVGRVGAVVAGDPVEPALDDGGHAGHPGVVGGAREGEARGTRPLERVRGVARDRRPRASDRITPDGARGLSGDRGLEASAAREVL